MVSAFVESVIEYAKRNSCSDVHLTENAVPSYRRFGNLETGNFTRCITCDDILSLAEGPQKNILLDGNDLDFSCSLCGGRQRVNIFRESGKYACAIRLLNDRVPTLEELKMPAVLKTLAEEPQGLILVTGPTGSGKSTTLAAMINYIASVRKVHIVTIEDPIEYVYESGRSLIHQREIDSDTDTFAGALRSVLREDPDAILVGEMRDYETISAAVTAAEIGHLVFSTLHTAGAARTVDRIVEVFPPYAQNQIRTQLAGAIKGVMTQKLIPLADGSGRIAAMEIMVSNDAVQNLIREGKCHQINSVIHSGAAQGMQTMEASLASLVRQGFITYNEAMASTLNKEVFRSMVY